VARNGPPVPYWKLSKENDRLVTGTPIWELLINKLDAYDAESEARTE